MTRPDNRQNHELRPVSFTPNVAPNATGSVLVAFGDTRVICACTIEENIPGWMKYQKVKGGWLTAEYSMLPYSTLDRKRRDITQGKLDGRSSEIQRLIGRSLRAVVDLKKLGPRTLWIDCDVLQADGGTRTASITGGAVAVAMALNKLVNDGKIKESPMKQLIAAVSAGVYKDTPILDLNYPEDRDASVDLNIVMTDDQKIVEIQGSGEEATFSRQEMNTMLDLAENGVKEILKLQQEAINQANVPTPPAASDLNDLASIFDRK